MKEMLIFLTTSMLNDSFTFKSLIIKCILFNNKINYSLKLLINIKAINYSFINEVITQIIYN